MNLAAFVIIFVQFRLISNEFESILSEIFY